MTGRGVGLSAVLRWPRRRALPRILRLLSELSERLTATSRVLVATWNKHFDDLWALAKVPPWRRQPPP